MIQVVELSGEVSMEDECNEATALHDKQQDFSPSIVCLDNSSGHCISIDDAIGGCNALCLPFLLAALSIGNDH